MAPMKAMKASKAMKGAVMTKGALADSLAGAAELKRTQVSKILDNLASIAAEQVKKAGKFVVPGVCMVKTRLKPATKAGKREVLSRAIVGKARPAKTVMKAFPVAAKKAAI